MIERAATFHYSRTPRRLLGLIDAPVDRVYRLLLRAVQIGLDLFSRTGRVSERVAVDPVEPPAVLGSGELFDLFLDRAGPVDRQLERRGRCLMPRAVRSRGSRPTLIEADRCYRRFLGRHGYVAVPEWVLSKADVSGSWGALMKEYRRRLDDNVRRVRNGGFGYRIDTDPATLMTFHDRMYLPYARARYGETALVASRPYLDNVLRTGFFLMVTWEGEDVAGLMISTAGPEPWLAFMGVLDGDFAHVRRGAVSAMQGTWSARCRPRPRV